jgi:hypothetical protein
MFKILVEIVSMFVYQTVTGHLWKESCPVGKMLSVPESRERENRDHSHLLQKIIKATFSGFR